MLPHAAELTGIVLVFGESSTQRNGIDNHRTIGIILVIIGVGYGLSRLQTGDPDTSTRNLYELTRQTAENTRHIFWLLVVGFVGLFGLLSKNKAP